MKAIVDTNVVLSGSFFGGLSGRVLEAWSDDQFNLVLLAPILADYREAGAEFEARYGGADFEAFAALLLVNCEVVEAPEHLPQPVCADPDDKFLACALAAGVRVITLVRRRLFSDNGAAMARYNI